MDPRVSSPAREGHAGDLPTAFLRIRVSEMDVTYGGGIVAGGTVVKWFGDVATELCVRYDGDEGLLAAYDMIEFKQPVHAGDFLELRGSIVKVGKRSRKIEMECHKVIACDPDRGPSAASVLPQPVLVARASGTVVAPKAKD
ncbi:MAG: hotdog domain-containing protein [Bacillota bacterium]|jgi:3-aminobutyryl-CoA ammonia-lyase